MSMFWARQKSRAKDNVDLTQIPLWEDYLAKLKKEDRFQKAPASFRQTFQFSVDAALNKKISLWRGDITTLKIDAIVNAANSGLWAGGGICAAIHSAAGRELADECDELGGCPTGQTKITKGYNLPSKHVLHTVGPTDGDPNDLESCYKTCLDVSVENKVRSVAFCCVATGIFGFDNVKAACIALETTRKWLATGDNKDKFDRIIFCTFMEQDYKIYNALTPVFFPVEPSDNAVTDEEKKLLESEAAGSPKSGKKREGEDSTDSKDEGGDGPRAVKRQRSQDPKDSKDSTEDTKDIKSAGSAASSGNGNSTEGSPTSPASSNSSSAGSPVFVTPKEPAQTSSAGNGSGPGASLPSSASQSQSQGKL